MGPAVPEPKTVQWVYVRELKKKKKLNILANNMIYLS